MADEPLPLPLYAKALAHLLADRDRPAENVLGALGITAAQLEAADAHYSEPLRLSLRRRKGMLAMAFASAFAEARRDRGPQRPAAEPEPPAPAAATPAIPSYMSPARPPAPAWQSAPPASVPPSPVAPALVAPVVAPPAPVSVSAQPPPSSGIGTGTAPPSHDAPRPETPWSTAHVSQRVGKLTVAHFAALTVEMSRNPPDPAPVLRRYGLASTDDFAHVHAMFHAQMAVDPTMKAQFESLVTHMRAVSRRDG